MPVISGYQAVITKWFRSKSYLPEPPAMFNRDINELIPAYTDTGFTKSKLPVALFAKIQTFYDMKFDLIVALTYVLMDIFYPCFNYGGKNA